MEGSVVDQVKRVRLSGTRETLDRPLKQRMYERANTMKELRAVDIKIDARVNKDDN